MTRPLFSPRLAFLAWGDFTSASVLLALLSLRKNEGLFVVLIAATCRGETSQRQIASSAMDFLCENLRLRNRILSQKHVAKNQIIQNFATYCGDKILLQTHEAICRCNVSPQRVASTSRPTCTHRLTCRRDVLLQLVARPVHTE